MGFFSRLEKRAVDVNSLLCVGLDPHSEDLSSVDPKSAREFCLRIIGATSEFILAYKPNSAFFEVFGAEGIAVLEEIITYIPEEIPVILDAKRGDIASSAQAYAKAVFETLGVDAVTINPYLGFDSLQPFIGDDQQGAFLLCKTSNPSAAEIQDLEVAIDEGGTESLSKLNLYELIAKRAVEWNQVDNVGLVVGSTQIDSLKRVRTQAPELWLLAPGIGAQGGNLESALEAGLRPDGLGMVIPISRAISRQPDPGQAAKDINDRINQARNKIKRNAQDRNSAVDHNVDSMVRLAIDLLEFGCVKFGTFKLKSGLDSPIYIDLRRLVGLPDLLTQVASSYFPVLSNLIFDRLAALPYAGLPIATAISLHGGYPLVYPRKEVKDYGTQAVIEGIYESGERAVLIDDLATTGGSKFEAIEKLSSVGLNVKDVVVLIDRQSGASEYLANSGYMLHAIFKLSQLLDYWKFAGLISKGQVAEVRNFIASTRKNIEK
jgi:uridine monophosphate synthetase